MANQFGSFGAGVSPDAMQAIRDALARRQQGGGTPALNQQSGASPTASPLPPQPQGGVEMPQEPIPAGAEAPPTTAGAPADEEARLIISALKERLKALSDTMTGKAQIDRMKEFRPEWNQQGGQ